ncbi:glycosyltransferase family 4 protein [Sabulicella glaciei]|uniref:Glycosyltransferase family 4 protein n=1 Tax=Sabulicella glaciei TaxID=2984948 RepID=A0ABT3NSZ6_9PROT|nr:glycosyltransferase family 4 protein [Roseococcus sp. MDT2-1-1]MCW8085287.1 glycosyltransferase family 4 protein [Roseococcus sp. MDT2-1-1]
MRIALLVPGPLSATSGGYIYDRRLLEGLRMLGHEIRVLELEGRFPAPDDTARRSAAEALAALEPGEAAVIDGLGLPGFDPAAPALRRAVGLIHHPTSLEPGVDKAVQERLERPLFAALARLVATSPLTARGLPALGADPDRVGVVEPGTDPAARAPGSGGERARILAVGSIIPRKGHDVLLRALGRLCDLDWELRIAGPESDPVHARTLRALVEELGLEGRVSFLGALGGDSLEAEYQSADIFALATHHEGYGMAAAEAQARGLPLAICTGGAIAEVVGPGAAIVAPPGNHDSLSRGLRRVIMDPDLRTQMGHASWRAGQRLPRWEDRAALFAEELRKAGHG